MAQNVNQPLVREGWCWWYQKHAPNDRALEQSQKKRKKQSEACGVIPPTLAISSITFRGLPIKSGPLKQMNKVSAFLLGCLRKAFWILVKLSLALDSTEVISLPMIRGCGRCFLRRDLHSANWIPYREGLRFHDSLLIIDATTDSMRSVVHELLAHSLV